jgi:hypothetical protein
VADGLLPPCVLGYFLNREIDFDETFWVVDHSYNSGGGWSSLDQGMTACSQKRDWYSLLYSRFDLIISPRIRNPYIFTS